MGKKLTNNLKLKILSVFLAFFVWLAVTNISNPDVTATKEVPLEVLNEDVLSANGKTYELLDNRSTVTVAYKVRTLDAGSISASDFRAYIDLADMYEPTGAVPVKVDIKNSKVDAVTAKPMVIRVTTEDVQQKKFELTAYRRRNRVRIQGRNSEHRTYQHICKRTGIPGGTDQYSGYYHPSGRGKFRSFRYSPDPVL